MPTDWRSPWEAAIRERDPAKVVEACEQARRAIYARVFELLRESPGHPPERVQVEHALRSLFFHFHAQIHRSLSATPPPPGVH